MRTRWAVRKDDLGNVKSPTVSPVAVSSMGMVLVQLLALAGCWYPFARGEALLAAYSPPFDGLGWCGVGITCAGIGLGVMTLAFNRFGNFSVFPEPLSGARLVTNGPYRWVRHPIYVALLGFALGPVLVLQAWPNVLAWGVLVGVLIVKLEREERYLREVFPEYSSYAARTARLVPGVW